MALAAAYKFNSFYSTELSCVGVLGNSLSLLFEGLKSFGFIPFGGKKVFHILAGDPTYMVDL
jgi:hypothetical protein